MIPVYCHSNLDLDPRERWPSHLPCVPRVGDLVESAYTWGSGVVLVLEVVGVTWAAHCMGHAWYHRVELHLMRRAPSHSSIKEFQEWYKKVREPGKT